MIEPIKNELLLTRLSIGKNMEKVRRAKFQIDILRKRFRMKKTRIKRQNKNKTSPQSPLGSYVRDGDHLVLAQKSDKISKGKLTLK